MDTAYNFKTLALREQDYILPKALPKGELVPRRTEAVPDFWMLRGPSRPAWKDDTHLSSYSGVYFWFYSYSYAG